MTINVPASIKTIEVDGEVEGITIEDGVLKIKVKNQIIFNIPQPAPYTPLPATPNPWAPGTNPWPAAPPPLGDYYPWGPIICGYVSTRVDMKNLVAVN
jgi:hypothetical protein